MNTIVDSKRIQYTAGKFAKDSLIYLQEVGTSKTNKANTNTRKHMRSYLFFIVLEGNGTLTYAGFENSMKAGDCAFIDCRLPYSHYSDNWKIAWIHFYGANVSDIYYKYLERNGKNVFSSRNNAPFSDLINEIFQIASSLDYIKDMAIYNKIIEILYLIMKETVYDDANRKAPKYDIKEIRQFIDSNYTENISLNILSEHFYINKYYLTRLFKENYGLTINNYIMEKRITKAKELLRFSNFSIEKIAVECGIKDANYFSRIFKKIEGITPKEYKQTW